ncbi:hypothetical protein QAD02_022755 [Eretmocerus hayati]|uniref:Uncharacterized protein n=1 Tax=Eretmocerus hayati TaxID=131215 RepID=A0ACC2PTV9_9HYME|nr:hypothetical protein QAD02_022755 [Eretmocerus hayati]
MDPREYLLMEPDGVDDLLHEIQRELINFLDEACEAYVRDEIRALDANDVGLEDLEMDEDEDEDERGSGDEKFSSDDTLEPFEEEEEDLPSRVVPKKQPRTISTSDEEIE